MRHDPLAGKAEGDNDLLKADQLERDIGHRRQDAGRRNRKLQPFVAIAAKHKIGGGDVAVFVRDRPQARQRQVEERIDDDRVGHGEEPEGANGEDDRRNRDDRVGGVEIAPEQEPGYPTAKAPASKAPFVDVSEIGGFPTRRDKAKHRHQAKKEDEDSGGDEVEVVEHRLVLTDPIRGKNCERRERNEDQLEPEKERDTEKDRRNRVVERDPERQNTRESKRKSCIIPPGSRERGDRSRP